MQLALIPLLVASVLPNSDDGPFLQLCFDDALTQAKESEKVVFIDFFTTWCGPCKKLDQVTWKDAEVVAWLDEHTVPLKLDAEIEVELAKRYGVDRYPTMVFIEPGGELRARLTGYKPPQEFLEQASDGLLGIKPSDTARAKLEQHPTDWNAHSDLADLLAAEGRFEEALEHYLWCFDEGLEHSPSHSGVRLSFLLGDIIDLGRKYPPALEAMRGRRDAAGEALLEGAGDLQTAMDFCSLNDSLGEKQRSLELYERLVEEEGPVDHSNPLDRKSQLFDSALDVLMEAKRYDDVISGFGDYQAWLDREDASYDQMAALSKDDDPDDDIESMLRGMTVAKAAKLYRAMASVEGCEGLEALEQAIVEFHPKLYTWRKLMHTARTAGRVELQERLRTAALEQLPEDQHRRIPRVRGR